MPYVNGITGSWPWFRRYGPTPRPTTCTGTWRRCAPRSARKSRSIGSSPGGPAAADVHLRDRRHVARRHAVKGLEIRTNSYWRFGWTLDPVSGGWIRSDAGKTIVDEVTGEPLTATSIVVQRVSRRSCFGDPDPGQPATPPAPRRRRRRRPLRPGKAIALHWSRPTSADGTRWTYADSGEPVILPLASSGGRSSRSPRR